MQISSNQDTLHLGCHDALGNRVPQKAGYVQCVAPELKSLTEATPKLEYKVANATDKVETKLREPEEGTDAWGCQETSRGGDN